MRLSTISLAASLLALSFTVAAAAGCGSDSNTSGGGGEGGDGGSGGAGGANACAGLACGDTCPACEGGTACACDADGQCVEAGLAVCSACPATPPSDGDACPKPGLVCEAEEGIVIVCRARATCTDKGWQNLAPGCSSDPGSDPKCPATKPMGACDVANDPGLCPVETTYCGCSNCLGGPCGGAGEWVCIEPPAPPCPAIAPKLGAPCSQDKLACVYGACPLGGTTGGRSCLDGVWKEDIVPCPL
jgi:hypothetical protein